MIFGPSGGAGGISAWVTGTVYAVGDVIYYNQSTYLCKTAHTAAAAFETDFSAIKWQLLSQLLPNYISDYDGSNIGKWATYADAAGTSPVDGTGGSPTITYAVSTDSSLRGTTNFLFTHGASNQQGQGFSYDFSIDPSDKGKVLQCSLEYLIASGTYASGDLTFWIYDVTNSTLIQPAPYSLQNSGIIEKFAFEFQTSSSSTSYRLIGHVTTTTATAYTIRFRNWNCGPQAKLYGSPVTDWVSYTPTISHASGGITNNTNTFLYRRFGDSIQVRGHIQFSAASAAFNGLFVSLPSGLAFDSSKIGSTTAGRVTLGYGAFLDDGVQNYAIAKITYDTSSRVDIQYTNLQTHTGTAPAFSNSITNSTPFTYGANDSISIFFEAPILGWSSSTIMSSDANTNVIAFKAAGTVGQTFTTVSTPQLLNFTTVVKDSNGAYDGTNKYTIPVSGWYKVGALFYGNVVTQAINNENELQVYKNGSSNFDGFTVNRLDRTLMFVANSPITLRGTGEFYFNAGDYIQLYLSPSASLTVTKVADGGLNYFWIEKSTGPAQIQSSEIIAARYTTSAGNAVTNATTTFVDFGTKDYDTHGIVSGNGSGNVTTTNTGFKATIPVSGKYRISCATLSASGGGWAAGEEWTVTVYIDGAAGPGFLNFQTATHSTYVRTSGDVTLNLLAGQRVEIAIYQSSGASLNIANIANRNWFEILKVGNY